MLFVYGLAPQCLQLFVCPVEIDLLKCLCQLFGLERASMIFFLVFHEAHPLAHDGTGKDDIGGCRIFSRLLERSVDLVKIVSVDLDADKSRGFVFVAQVLRHDIIPAAGYLEHVIVDNDRYIVQAVLSDEPSCLGDLPLLLLTVSHDDKTVHLHVFDPGGYGKSACNGKTLPEIPCSPRHTGDRRLDMTFKDASHPSESLDDLFRVEESPAGQCGVNAGRGMSVRDHHFILIHVDCMIEHGIDVYG